MVDEREGATPRGKGRHSLGRAMGAAGLFLVVAIACAVLYLQTEDGFRRVVVPLASRGLGSAVTAERGHLSLAGRVEIEKAAFGVPSAGLEVAFARLVVRLSPVSFLSGDRPRIEEVDLDGLRLTVDERPVKGETDEVHPERDDGSFGIVLPVDIDAFRARDARIFLRNQGATSAAIGPLDLQVRNLHPGARATIVLDGAVLLWPEGPRARSVKLHAGAEVDQNEDARVKVAEIDGWVEFEATPEEARAATLRLQLEGAMTAEPDSALTVSMRAETSRGGGRFAHLAGEGQWQTGSPHGALPRSLTAELAIEDATGFNPLLELLDANHVERGSLDARVELSPENDATRITVTAEGRDLATHVSNGTDSTPALNVRISQRGLLAPNAGRLRVDEAALRVASADGGSLESTLDSPLVVDLAASADAAAGQEAQRSVWKTRIDGLQLRYLHSWLATFGSRALDGLGGKLGGHLDVAVARSGQRIGAEGEIRIDGLTVVGPGADVGPLGVATDLDFAVRDLDRFEIGAVEVRLSTTRSTFLTASATGTYEIAKKRGKLGIDMASPDLAAALGALALLPPESRKQVLGGKTHGSFEVDLAPKVAEVKGKASIDGVTLIVGAERIMPHDVRLETEMKAGGGVLEIAKLSVGVDGPGNGKPARLEASGVLSTGSGKGTRPTDLRLSVGGLRLGPWVDALGGPGVDRLGELPVDADLALKADPSGSGLTVEGQEKVELRQPGGVKGQTVEVSLSNTISLPPDGGSRFSLDLSARGAGGSDDRAKIAGEFRPAGATGEAAGATLAIDLERLDATPYLAPFLGERSAKKGAHDGAVARGDSGKTTGQDGSTPLDIDANVKIGWLKFREIEIASGRVRAARNAGQTLVEISPTQVAGGRLDGRFEHRSGSPEALSWSAHSASIDVGRLYRSLVGDGRRVEGILRLDTSGQGSGGDVKTLRDSILGKVDAKMTDARFSGLPLLTYMAKVTGIREFEDLVFNTFESRLDLRDGKAHIKHMEGSGLAANLKFTGKVTLTGNFDVEVHPRLGPSMSGKLGKIFGVGLLVETATDFVALPIDVTVQGPYDNLQFGVLPRMPGALDKLTGNLTATATGAVVGAGQEVGKGVAEGAGASFKGGAGLIKKGGSLFGRKK